MPSPAENISRLRRIVRDCGLCPRRCRVDRVAGQRGACGIAAEAVVTSAGPHFGEEPCLVGSGGSGTIFFAGCNLDCVFCQNFDISHPAALRQAPGGLRHSQAAGRETSPAQIAAMALGLQRDGCENINFVTPTHVAHAVAEAVALARDKGLEAPVVYNCGGYEAVRTLRLLAGLVDIYMPDFKYADAEAGQKYSGVADYPAAAQAALAEMYRQVGPLRLTDRGVAYRGVLVRHLLMPHDIARSREVIDIVAAAAPGCTINVMGQYRPAYRAEHFPELMGRPDTKLLASLRAHATARGLKRVD